MCVYICVYIYICIYIYNNNNTNNNEYTVYVYVYMYAHRLPLMCMSRERVQRMGGSLTLLSLLLLSLYNYHNSIILLHSYQINMSLSLLSCHVSEYRGWGGSNHRRLRGSAGSRRIAGG